MRIVGRKELITQNISLKELHLGILCDDHQVIKGAVINFKHSDKKVCIHLPNKLSEVKFNSTFETDS